MWCHSPADPFPNRFTVGTVQEFSLADGVKSGEFRGWFFANGLLYTFVWTPLSKEGKQCFLHVSRSISQTGSTSDPWTIKKLTDDGKGSDSQEDGYVSSEGNSFSLRLSSANKEETYYLLLSQGYETMTTFKFHKYHFKPETATKDKLQGYV